MKYFKLYFYLYGVVKKMYHIILRFISTFLFVSISNLSLKSLDIFLNSNFKNNFHYEANLSSL